VSIYDGNRLLQTQSWDPAGRLQEQLLGRSDDKATLLKREYKYDAAGQLADINDSRRGQLAYRYDPVGRLLSATTRQGMETFAFDPAGNLLDDKMTEIRRPLDLTPPRSKLVDNLLREYAGTHYDYDERGNQIQRWYNGQRSDMRWDLFDRLMHFEDSRLAVDFAYDALGRRLHKNSNAHYRHRPEAGSQWNRNEHARRQRELGCGFTLYGWDGDNLAWESSPAQVDGGPGRTVHYVFEPGTFIPVAQAVRHAPIRLMGQPDYSGEYSLKDDPLWNYKAKALPFDALAWYQCDHLGTPQELTDQQGNMAWSAQYKAWGQVTEQRSEWSRQHGVTNPIRFQGQYHDHETGLHYNRYRYYDPGVGRFISKDPIGYTGGLNLYFYGDNPVGLIDPLGLAGHKVGANTAGQDVLARGVHVNVNGSGLPPAGGHIALKPNAEGTHVVLEPADKATRAMPDSQWGKACECVLKYLDKPGNVDRLTKAAQAGVDANPNSARVPELKQVGTILSRHHAAGTNPVARK
jgi:RHS repeat-associated protein